MSDDLTALIWAPLATGVIGGALVSMLVGVTGWLTRTVVKRRARRRQIISLMGRAVALQARAINDGRFDRTWIENSSEPLASAHETYDDLTAQALDLFEPGEEVVAMWTAVEFYAGWSDPFHYLSDTGTPRKNPGDGLRLLTTNSLAGGWVAPRPQLLADWARVRWPWDRGSARGPRYADLFTAGDMTRHHIVIPNSDVNVDMLRPFIAYLNRESSNPWRTPSKRETERLDAEWDQRNDAWAEERERLTGKPPKLSSRRVRANRAEA